MVSAARWTDRMNDKLSTKGSKVQRFLLQDPEGISIVQNNFIIKQSYGNVIFNKSLLSLTSSPSISSTPRFMELESMVTVCSEQR